MANKSDRETAESARALADWWQRWGGERRKVSAIRGNIDLTLLDEPRRNTARCRRARSTPTAIPTSGLAALSWRNTSAGADISTMAGYQGCGWIFDAETVLTPSACSNGRLAPVGRVKGVMRIAEGRCESTVRGGSPYRDPQRRSAR